jgi:hypothetical protein
MEASKSVRVLDPEEVIEAVTPHVQYAAIPETGALTEEQWVRIDEEHLPKEGDEVGYWSVTGLGELWLVRTVAVNWNLSQCRSARWTHYRPNNAPTGKDTFVKTSVYRELERQLAEARKATEWKPFETAPTNGTEIIVYREDAGVFMASFRPSAGDDGEFGPQMNGDECWFDNYGDDLTGDLPTSWMPKPQGPITAPQGKESHD